ncbi:MAG: tryptophan synthase subunit alpha [Candidatus Bathyarchaeia archaeon]
MTTAISDAFKGLRKRGEGALIGYVTGGDPSPKYTPLVVEALVEGGVDIVEIGVPFSDPIADGPVIQSSVNRALKAGTTPQTIFKIARRLSKRIDTPTVLLTYYNILHRMGVNRFLREASENGVSGLIVPDLPFEEGVEYREDAVKQGLDTIFLASPSTPKSRLESIVNYTSGFLYLISVFGVTGVRKNVDPLTIRVIAEVKPYVEKTIPLAVGFGVSKPEHVRVIINHGADGVIAGSVFVKTMEKNLRARSQLREALTAKAGKLKAATLPMSNTACPSEE